MMDLTGQRFGRLVVLSFSRRRVRDYLWNVRCDCGVKKETSAGGLTRGTAKSCGCLARELSSLRESTHGMIGTPSYLSWRGILNRCFNRNDKRHFPLYGGRGITVCQRWLAFENFYEDMGERPQGKTLDRIKNNGNYEPGNCRWATQEQQRNNQRCILTLRGKSRFKGVYFQLGKWRAVIAGAGKSRHLGSFCSDVDAAHAYDSAATIRFGDRAVTNAALGRF